MSGAFFKIDYDKEEAKITLDPALKALDGIIKDVKEKIATETFYAVIAPKGKNPFMTGKYVSSHRIGIDKADNSYESDGAGSMGEAQRIASKQLTKLKYIPVESEIFISNSVKSDKGFAYARMIESGWDRSKEGGKTGPWMVYANAFAEVAPQLQGWVDFIIHVHGGESL